MPAHIQMKDTKIDRESEALAFAHLLLPPGSGFVIELRALSVPIKGRDGETKTFVGYYDNAPDLARDALKLDDMQPKGVYALANPLTDDAVTRLSGGELNVFRKARTAAGDKDVLARRWLLLDIDPERPRDACSTEDQIENARLLALKVERALSEFGFPQPLIARSGNGVHLMYRTDLHAESTLPRNLTQALSARFSEGGMSVDSAVHNAARIWKFYGTTARKGDPKGWRIAHVIATPAHLEVVHEGALTQAWIGLAAPTPTEKTVPTRVQHHEKGERVGDWYDSHATLEDVVAILAQSGAKPTTPGQIEKWTRPGKDPADGNSATLSVGDIGIKLHVFTKSWPPFKENTPYRPFSILAYLAYGGDFKAAARDVAKRYNLASPIQEDKEGDEWGWKPYPTDLLPKSLSMIVQETARALNVEEAQVAVGALPVLGAAIGNSYRIKAKGGWVEPSILWSALVAPTGATKSPAFDVITRPTHEIEKKSRKQFKETYENYRTERQAWEGKEGGKDGGPKEPKEYRRVLKDATLEALYAVHELNPRGLLVHVDEFSTWLSSFNEYKKGGGDEGKWLEMYGGRATYIDRKGAGKMQRTYLAAPHVCVTGTVQPRYFLNALTSDRQSSGFSARLLAVMPPQRGRVWTDAEPSYDAVTRYRYLIEGLYRLKEEFTEEDEPEVLELSTGALSVFKEWYNANGDFIRSSPEVVRAMAVKAEAYPLRFALILHLCEFVETGRGGLVTEETMTKAVRLATWHRYELVRIYQELEAEKELKPVTREEKALASLPDVFTWQDVRDVFRVKERQAKKKLKELVLEGVAEGLEHGRYKKVRQLAQIKASKIRPE